jgi:quercetin dioxygenase-like cupin family protein
LAEAPEVTHGARVVDQDTTVLRGTIEFVVDGEAMTLTEGQLAALPGGTPHSATAGAGGAETLNAFTFRARRGE